MKSYLVSYDLIGPNRDYEKVADVLRTYGYRSRPLESVWLIKTSKTAVEVRNHIKTALDSNDKLLVTKLTGEAAWKNLSDKTGAWIKDNL